MLNIAVCQTAQFKHEWILQFNEMQITIQGQTSVFASQATTHTKSLHANGIKQLQSWALAPFSDQKYVRDGVGTK